MGYIAQGRHDRAKPKAASDGQWIWMKSRYESSCTLCGLNIYRGDYINWNTSTRRAFCAACRPLDTKRNTGGARLSGSYTLEAKEAAEALSEEQRLAERAARRAAPIPTRVKR